MPLDRAALADLVEEVGAFRIRDRAMSRAQAALAKTLQDGGVPDEAALRAYLERVRRYFGGFEREARTRLADVDRRLARVAQLQFNLTAERGVAARRVERTQGVLARAEELAAR